MIRSLFAPAELAGMSVPNRVVLAPMTRNRASVTGVPAPYAAEYYSQRAAAQGGAGLLIAEGTQPSAQGQGYARTPGIYTDQQVRAWRAITDAVHAQGSRIFLQVMHAGRVSHCLNRIGAAPAVAPSAIASPGTIHTDQAGSQPYEVPQALTLQGISSVIDEHANATRNAIRAGFDGVELHAAGCYLPAQFLSDSSNRRGDRYGGRVENRIRFVTETLEAMVAAAGSASRVSLRISPGMEMAGVADSDPKTLYTSLVKSVAPHGLAYLHVMRTGGIVSGQANFDVLPTLRSLFTGPIIAAGDLNAASAVQWIASGLIDFAAFGRPFVANHDLARRLQSGQPLIEPDHSTFYVPGRYGYVVNKTEEPG